MFSPHKRPPCSVAAHQTSFICSVTYSRLISIHKSPHTLHYTTRQEGSICIKIEGSEKGWEYAKPLLGCVRACIDCGGRNVQQMRVSFSPGAATEQKACWNKCVKKKGSRLHNLFLWKHSQRGKWSPACWFQHEGCHALPSSGHELNCCTDKYCSVSCERGDH